MYLCEDWWVPDALVGLCLVFFIFTPGGLLGMKIKLNFGGRICCQSVCKLRIRMLLCFFY